MRVLYFLLGVLGSTALAISMVTKVIVHSNANPNIDRYPNYDVPAPTTVPDCDACTITFRSCLDKFDNLGRHEPCCEESQTWRFDKTSSCLDRCAKPMQCSNSNRLQQHAAVLPNAAVAQGLPIARGTDGLKILDMRQSTCSWCNGKRKECLGLCRVLNQECFVQCTKYACNHRLNSRFTCRKVCWGCSVADMSEGKEITSAQDLETS